MFLTMGVSLYTSRVVLNTLGVEDYGAYSLVGGVVVLFGFFNTAMSSATQRFLSFEIGTGDFEKLKQTFNATLNIHIGIALLVLVLAETLGLWFVNYKLNIDLERIDAINWVYQFSVLAFIISIIQVPYNSLIIARERMNIYAIYSIVEVLLKLGIVYLLLVSPYDKLKTYAVLMFIISSLIAFIYMIYCKKEFKESKYHFYYEPKYYQTLLSYSGWNLFGNIAAVARGQGINMILNLFFGTVVNAAYGITMQVQGAVNVFVTNFQMAVNPQIIKNYAQANVEQTHRLIFQSAKFSYFLMLILVMPIILNVDFILEFWLDNPPAYTSSFVILCLVGILIDCVSGPLMSAAQATGKIKWYQIVLGSLIFLCLPVSYFWLKNYSEPSVGFQVIIAMNFFSLIIRLFFLKSMMSLSIMDFFKEVIVRIAIVTIVSSALAYFYLSYLTLPNKYLTFIANATVVSLVNIILIFFIGLKKNERLFLYSFFKSKVA
jgi:O-antigen/teichoic acid export membrane protein